MLQLENLIQRSFDGVKTFDFDNDLSFQLKTEWSKVILKPSTKMELTMTVNFASKMLKEKDNGLGLDLIFLIDSSGSMEGSKLENVLHSIETILKILGEKDRVSIISFAKNAKLECDFIQVYKIKSLLLKKKSHIILLILLLSVLRTGR
jgi:hypothetical protein